MASRARPQNEKKLFDAHHNFVHQMVGAFITQPRVIAQRLGSRDWGDRYGFEAVEISGSRIAKVIRAIPTTTLAKHRAAYLADFSDTPFSFKKNRVAELARLYAQVDTITKLMPRSQPDPDDHNKLISGLSDIVKLTTKLKILRQIKDEMGEDVEKLADALRQGGNIVSVTMTKALMLEVSDVLREEAEAEATIEAGYADATVN